MGDAQDTIHDRVTHDKVWVGHVDFGPQIPASFSELPFLHPLEKVKVFFNRAVAVGGFNSWF